MEKHLPQPLHRTISPLPHPCSLAVYPGPFLLLAHVFTAGSTPGKQMWRDTRPTPSVCPSTSELWLRTKPMGAFTLR